MVEKCVGQNRDGSPCQAKPRPGSGRCPWHDEALAEQRRAWSKKGGQQRSNRARAKRALPDNVLTTLELRGLLGLTLKGVISGRVEPGVGTAAASIARTLNELNKTSELEADIAELQERAGIERSRA